MALIQPTMVFVRSNYTRSGVRRAGDDYQDIIALVWLVEGLEHPERYKRVRVEADDFGFLEDVVALRADDVVVAKQVKFSAHPRRGSVYWTHQLRELTTADLTPSSGQMLVVHRSLIDRESVKLGGVFAWICKITTHHRKYSHSEFAETHFVLDFGTTRIVREGS